MQTQYRRNSFDWIVYCAACSLSVATSAVDAAPAIVERVAVDSGWYRDNGTHTPSNPNYAVGQVFPTPDIHRNFFVFDLAGLPAPIRTATLSAFNPPMGFRSPSGVETWQLHEVVTPVASLVSGSGGVAAYADLGDGTEFGATSITPADDGRSVTVSFNEAAVAALNQATGLWAVGGALTSMDNDPSTDEAVFGGSHIGGHAELILELVPEPSAAMLAMVSLFCFAFRRNRHSIA